MIFHKFIVVNKADIQLKCNDQVVNARSHSYLHHDSQIVNGRRQYKLRVGAEDFYQSEPIPLDLLSMTQYITLNSSVASSH